MGWQQEALKKLNSLKELEDDWHGAYPSKAMTDKAYETAGALIRRAPRDGEPPWIVPTMSGGVNIEWIVADDDGLEVGVGPDGGLGILLEEAGDYVLELEGGDCPPELADEKIREILLRAPS